MLHQFMREISGTPAQNSTPSAGQPNTVTSPAPAEPQQSPCPKDPTAAVCCCKKPGF